MVMSISVHCECGQRLKARDQDRGKRAKCPSCGAALTIEDEVVLEAVEEHPEVPPRYQAVTLDIGRLAARNGAISMSIRIDDCGNGEVMLFVVDDDSRRSVGLICFGPDKYESFLKLIEQTNATIKRLQASKQMGKMLTGP